MQKGFTLIETLIYIALFGIILTGVITSAYPLITGAEKLSQRVTEEGEAAFVFHKIGWALSSSTAITLPATNTLKIKNVGGSYLWLHEGNAGIEIFETSNAGVTPSARDWILLTAERAFFSAFTASVVIGTPNAVSVAFSVNGEPYSQTYNVFY
ncbi:MAG: hypothetical protein A3C06_04185 [Candidatus Taylorbacteria bacterium RIFCSPHIGHO2_02_FULL_46_13]|uniref:Prepilin-type N-terminal cleavage/methylation domain-containing protein n=1 Tax=Candidatus Taylorbacteria bacterium RIFCSPHIGHO2_02_FULL_46_13 TaxID=1802312 RepID=A0A1G2MUC8_9BACT|nr:MAG: hypothetical protein A3C06_04185 [Candidatus Taylorbacteria bacterium RIFCSPHIGHO2_02_FULL_46_13]